MFFGRPLTLSPISYIVYAAKPVANGLIPVSPPTIIPENIPYKTLSPFIYALNAPNPAPITAPAATPISAPATHPVATVITTAVTVKTTPKIMSAFFFNHFLKSLHIPVPNGSVYITGLLLQ